MNAHKREYIHDEDILNGEFVVFTWDSDGLRREVATFQWGPGLLAHDDAEFMADLLVNALDEETA